MTQSNKYEYILEIIIDKLNYSSKHVNNFVQKVISNCNNQIRKYILNHIHSLLFLEKEIIIDIKILLKALNPDFPDTNKIIISMIKLFINNGKNISYAL